MPVFDEAGNLPQLHEELLDVLERAEGGFELLYVDDGSRDESRNVLRTLRKGDRRVRVICLRHQSGQTAALAAGFYPTIWYASAGAHAMGDATFAGAVLLALRKRIIRRINLKAISGRLSVSRAFRQRRALPFQLLFLQRQALGQFLLQLGGFLLAVPHVGIFAVSPQQFRVAATLYDTPTVQDQNLIGINDRRQAVGDHQS